MRKTLLRLALSALVTVLLVLSIEGAAHTWTNWQATGQLPPLKELSHCEYDPELGWRHLANKVVPDLYGKGLTLTTNSQHLRGTRDCSLQDTENTYRILCLGDSFTMGYGVGDEDTYPAQLAQQHPAIDTINMGLGGYGIDQCYLWYERDGTKFDVDVLLFAFIIGDFFRMNPWGNVADMGKPVLELVDGNPVAVNVPVVNVLEVPRFGTRLTRLWQTSALAHLLPTTLAAPALGPVALAEQPFVPVALRIFEILRDQSRERGQLFVLAMLPAEEEVPQARLELIDGWLRPALEERGIPLLDLRAAFQQVPKTELPGHFTLGHFSKRGNLLAAKALLEGIRRLDPACPR
ncbi:MAG TPA: GDSL-type esterase/lipase family protein [Planctomycetota bacterium]|nr:GDSL-type esterase/lipase family protein [Planctomycetota bacterium]